MMATILFANKAIKVRRNSITRSAVSNPVIPLPYLPGDQSNKSHNAKPYKIEKISFIANSDTLIGIPVRGFFLLIVLSEQFHIQEPKQR